MSPLARLSRIALTLLLVFTPVTLSAHGFRLLVFTKTAGFVHGSIPAGITAINQLAVEHDFTVTQTADSTVFISQLANHDVVVFLNTTGDVLNASEQDAFQAWYQNGGAYVGIHAASDTEPDWPWYLDLVGAKFANHPAVQVGTVDFLDQVHPITNVIDPATGQRVIEWTLSEEWYNFTTSPRGKVHVLAHLNEAIASTNPEEPARPGTTGGTHGNDHPIMWCQEFDGGRSAYLALGHADATYSTAIFRGLMVNAIEWAAGTGGDSGATINSNYEKIVLDSTVSNPMALAIDSTGKVYFVERKGAVKVHNQSTGQTRVIGNLSTYSGGEYGLLGITLAPDFNTSRNLYILWSPTTGNNNRLSRFTLDNAGDLNLASEVSIIEYFTNRNAGHHQAGSIAFAPDGNLFMSLGDNTWASQYSPRNDTSIANDARKGSPNSNDLRGGLVRIRPNVGGGPPAHPNYTIPSGNMFPVGTPLTRPEIYTKGARNCFRIAVDPVTGWVYYGDVGPDASTSTINPFEGIRGHDEFNQVKAPGWFGWPYFLGNGKPYLDGAGNPWTITTARADLATYFTLSSFLSNGGQAGNPALIPDPASAWIWYPYGDAGPQFSELGSGGRCAMAGGVYSYALGKNFPAYYDRSVFVMEWSRNRIYDIRTRPDGSILEITRFAPHLSFDRPIEMEFGPDGAMYIIEWGTDFGTSESASAKLVKVQYTNAAATPVAVASSNVTSGSLPLTVNFSSAGSFDPDSTTISYAWDFNGDFVTDSTEPNPSRVFTTAGTYLVQLTVTDGDQLFSRANLTISAGNNAPVVTFNSPGNFSFFDWGDQVNFSLSVTDAEDGSTASGSIPASSVMFEGSLGHDDHQHNEVQLSALSGTVPIPRDAAHTFDQDLGYAFDAFYTDLGAPGVQPIQASATVFLQPKVTQAQTRDGQSGTTTAPTSDPVGGVQDVNSIDHGDYIFFSGLNLAGIQSIQFRVSAAGVGGNIEIRQGSPAGNLLGTAVVTNTGSTYRDFGVTSLQNVLPGSNALYFVFTRAPGATDLFRLNWINFRGSGATAIPDRPRLSSTAITAPNTLRLIFNQTMDLSSLRNLANYSVDKGATVTAATPFANQSGVVLSFNGLSAGNYHTLSLTGLTDLAGDAVSPGTRATFLNLQAAPPQFVMGLNAGGPNFTDSSGNLYIADTTPAPAPVSLLVDFANGSSNPVPANASHFMAADSNVSSTAVVNFINVSNPTATALTGTNISGVTFTNTGANGIYSTGNGGFVDGVPLLDGYIFESSVNGATATVNGLGDIPAGTPITLTLWGTGDTPNSDTQYTVSYNGTTVGTAATDYDTIGAARPANTVPARVSFTFNKVAAVNSITIVWGKVSAATSTAGFGAFSLTATQGVPAAPVSYFSTGSTFSTSNAIANTTDDVLYQTERYSSGNFIYSIPLPSARYQVLLRFAEIFATSPGSRIFNARIEGGSNLFSPDLDLVARTGGKDRAFDQTIEDVTVSDGVLNVELLKGSIDNPKISAIGVFRYPQTASIPDPSFATFLNRQPGASFNAGSDVDNDGLSALLEYALGGSEGTQDTARLPRLLPFSVSDFEFVFTRPKNLPDLNYTIEASNDLSVWSPVSPTLLVTSISTGTEELRFRGLRSAANIAGIPIQSQVFFRLSVSLKTISP